MPKTNKVTIDLEKLIMTQVREGKINMKPKWYFALGSIMAVVGLAGLTIVAVFLLNITFFLLKPHGPMGQWRLQMLLASLPLWIPALAIVSILGGILLLKKYDFAYKHNFWVILAGFILAVALAALAIDSLGLNDRWTHRGPMRRFYQQLENPNIFFPRNQGWGRHSNELGR